MAQNGPDSPWDLEINSAGTSDSRTRVGVPGPLRQAWWVPLVRPLKLRCAWDQPGQPHTRLGLGARGQPPKPQPCTPDPRLTRHAPELWPQRDSSAEGCGPSRTPPGSQLGRSLPRQLPLELQRTRELRKVASDGARQPATTRDNRCECQQDRLRWQGQLVDEMDPPDARNDPQNVALHRPVQSPVKDNPWVWVFGDASGREKQ